MQKYTIWSLATLILLFSCKTQEEIQRDKVVDQLAVQIVENQKISTDSTTKIQELEQQISFMRGKLEEAGHELEMNQSEKNQQWEERIKVLEEGQEEIKNSVKQLAQDIVKNKEFIQEVLKNLKKMSAPAPKTKSKSNASPFDSAMANYKKGRYKTARGQLEELLESNKYKGKRKARIIHNLGMVAYMQKRYDDSLVYFSRLYTEFPKVGYVKNGLLFLGRSFVKKGQKEQAKQTFNELISKFPKSSSANHARNDLRKL